MAMAPMGAATAAGDDLSDAPGVQAPGLNYFVFALFLLTFTIRALFLICKTRANKSSANSNACAPCAFAPSGPRSLCHERGITQTADIV